MSGEKGENELQYEEIINIIDQSKSLGVSVVSLSGGDPSVHSDLFDIIRNIREREMDILLYTSGIEDVSSKAKTNFCEHDMNILSDLLGKDSAIIFSIEGNKKNHDYITGIDGSFNATIRAITLAKDYGMNVELHFTPMKHNINDIDDFFHIAELFEINKVSFLRFVPQGRALINDCAITPYQFMELQQKLYEYKGNVKFRIGCPLSSFHLLGYEEYRPFCHAGSDLLLIRPDGEVHFCAACKNTKDMALGNVRKQSLEDIWINSPILKMVRDYNSDPLNARGFCTDCPQKQFCGGFCIAQRVLFNQDNGINTLPEKIYEGCDPMCLRFNGLLDDDVINHNRKKIGFKVRQDKEGNVIR
jgi:radical SAM protein with 4Fe4S-binding SPASM domain